MLQLRIFHIFVSLYPDLSDEQFANFRAITTTGIGAGKLYRSSSPVNPETNRNLIADRAVSAGITKLVCSG